MHLERTNAKVADAGLKHFEGLSARCCPCRWRVGVPHLRLQTLVANANRCCATDARNGTRRMDCLSRLFRGCSLSLNAPHFDEFPKS